MLPRFAVLALALVACAPPVEQSDAAPDRTAPTMDAHNDATNDTSAPPMDTGVIIDTGIPPQDTGTSPTDTGVPPRDTGVQDTGLAPCTLDSRNCGMCGRVCSGGTPACAEVSAGRWGCVNNCGGFGEGCDDPGGGRTICCASGCGPGGVGCR